MRARDIITELSELERKRDEIGTVLKEAGFGEALGILSDAFESYDKKVTTFLDAELEPKAPILFITASAVGVGLTGGTTYRNLVVTATYADGSTKNVTKQMQPLMLYSDFDRVRNNSGFLKSVDVSGYIGAEATFEIVKTSTGYDVDDLKNTQGLGVVATAPESGKYKIVDKNGEALGISFEPDSDVLIGDNWLIDIYFVSTGTTYTIADSTVATVDENGVITAVGGGQTTLEIRNGASMVEFPCVVTDDQAPEPPDITEVNALEGGAEIIFDPSVSLDTASYSVFVGGSLNQAGITTSPVYVDLYADNITTYAITMTAVDTSGNESIPSDIAYVTPMA